MVSMDGAWREETKMSRSRAFVVFVCLVSAIGASSVGATSKPPAVPKTPPVCHDVDADFTSELATEGCASPLGLCASGTIKHDELLRGPMSLVINDGAPSAGMPQSEPPSVLSVSGERTLTPRRGGTLSAHVIGTGILDPATGSIRMFDEINLIAGGTGRFAGATGTLQVFGQATSPTTFAGEIRGTVCLP